MAEICNIFYLKKGIKSSKATLSVAFELLIPFLMIKASIGCVK